MVKYYTTATIHIVSQINAHPRRLQTPFTNCHNALKCIKKLTYNHQFCLTNCGAKLQPTYISACTWNKNYHWWTKDDSLTKTVQSKAAAMLYTNLWCSQVESLPMGTLIPMTYMATFIQLSQPNRPRFQIKLFF